MATFLTSGVLTIAFALGLRLALRGTRGGLWGPVLVALFGIGLMVAALFVPDPAWGFPSSVPDGVPDQPSFNAAMHGIGFMVAFLTVGLACVVFARRSLGHGDHAAAAYAVATAVVTFGLAAWPGTVGASLRYFATSVIVWTWTMTLIRSTLLLRTAHRGAA